MEERCTLWSTSTEQKIEIEITQSQSAKHAVQVDFSSEAEPSTIEHR